MLFHSNTMGTSNQLYNKTGIESPSISSVVYFVCSVRMSYSLQPRQAPLAMGFSRQEYWSGVPCPPPGDLLTQGSSPRHWCRSCSLKPCYQECSEDGSSNATREPVEMQTLRPHPRPTAESKQYPHGTHVHMKAGRTWLRWPDSMNKASESEDLKLKNPGYYSVDGHSFQLTQQFYLPPLNVRWQGMIAISRVLGSSQSISVNECPLQSGHCGLPACVWTMDDFLFGE